MKKNGYTLKGANKGYNTQQGGYLAVGFKQIKETIASIILAK